MRNMGAKEGRFKYKQLVDNMESEPQIAEETGWQFYKETLFVTHFSNMPIIYIKALGIKEKANWLHYDWKHRNS